MSVASVNELSAVSPDGFEATINEGPALSVRLWGPPRGPLDNGRGPFN